MNLSHTIRVAALVLLLTMWAAAQNDDTARDNGQGTAPAPAFGQEAPILSPENPPISGLDQPILDFKAPTRSFFSPGLAVSEEGNTNPNDQLGKSSLSSVTRLLGAFDLQRFWPRSDMFLEYLGGGAFYSNAVDSVRQLQSLAFLGVTRWRTGQLSIRDSFNYLPEGTFSVGAFGGTPGFGLSRGSVNSGLPGGGLPGILGNDRFGSIGLVPRLSNLVVVDAVQSLTPRSAVTIAGAYDTAHFFEQQQFLINSQQFTAEAGYSYMLNRRDQIAAVYGFQEFVFPLAAGGKVDAHVVNLRYSHTLTGRLSLLVGAGPQYTLIYQPGIATENRWSLSGTARLHYRFQHSSMALSYEKYTSAGSGFFAGAATQVGRLSYDRRLTRTWDFYGDLGYSYHKRLQALGGLGVSGNNYSDGFVSAVFRKHIGRNFGAFAAYRFNQLAFDNTFNQQSFNGRISHRHVAAIGFDWHPRPVRIE